MSNRSDEQQESDDSIWQDATVLRGDQTKDAKVHVTLRLEPGVYRAILTEKRAAQDRTITATIERLIKRGLSAIIAPAPDSLDAFVLMRCMVVHSAAQDALLEGIVAQMKPTSRKNKALVEHLRQSQVASEKLFSPLREADFSSIRKRRESRAE